MLTEDDIEIWIPSRRRVPDAIRCVGLWPKGKVTVCVDEDEADDYKNVDAPLVVHPPMTHGLGQLRQWINDHCTARCCVQCNDDVRGLRCLVGLRSRTIRDPATMFRVIWQTANDALAAGTKLFSYSPTLVPYRLDPFAPILLNRLEGALLGQIDRELRYDPRVAQHDDIDLTLQGLLKLRFVWQDARYGPDHNFMTKSGGNSISRGQDRMKRELAYLTSKWGDCVGYADRDSIAGKSAGVPRTTVMVHVQRKQALEA